MDNSKYLNYYVEVLTGTMTDAVIRNISLQANARVTEDVVNEQVKKIEELATKLESVQIGKNQEIESKINSLENTVKGHLDTINNLTNQLTELNKMRGEYENVKHQVSHIDTFRNELNNERENHKKTRDEYQLKLKELNEQIEYLQLTPAKRKKVDELKLANVKVDIKVEEVPLNTTKAKIIKQTLPNEIIKDGGSF
jgi:chromosome segregation ATPase